MNLIGALLVVVAGVLAVLGLADLTNLAGELPVLAILALAVGVLLLHGPTVWRRP
jgi:hypothetical protein